MLDFFLLHYMFLTFVFRFQQKQYNRGPIIKRNITDFPKVSLSVVKMAEIGFTMSGMFK